MMKFFYIYPSESLGNVDCLPGQKIDRTMMGEDYCQKLCMCIVQAKNSIGPQVIVRLRDGHHYFRCHPGCERLHGCLVFSHTPRVPSPEIAGHRRSPKPMADRLILRCIWYWEESEGFSQNHELILIWKNFRAFY